MNALLNGWQLAGWTMIFFLAAGTLVLVLAGAVRLLTRRVNANVRYGVSLATFIVLAALPVVIACTLMASRERQRPEELTTKNTKVTKEDINAEFAMASRERQRPENLATEATESTEKIGESIVATTSNAPFDFERFLNQGIDYLPWVWIVGTPLTFLLLASGLIGAERLRRSCQLLSDGPIHVACEELRTALKISRKVGVAICDSISSPLVVGVVKPLILLPPAALTGWSPEHLEMVLVHELAHVRRWDNAVNLFQRVVESLLFFHPAVWIVSGWVRRDREDCCDAVVVRHTARPQAYAELLLALASHQPLAVSAAMARHPVASRIRRILKLQDEPMLVSRHALGFLASAVLACVLAVGFFAPSEAEESVSREATRSEAERASEETTNQTNRTNKEVATEATESTEEELNAGSAWEAEDAGAADNSLTEYTIVYDVKDSGAKFAKLIDHLRGMSEFTVTSSNDDQIVVMARRSVHKRVAEYLDFLRDIHEQPMKFDNRPIIYAEQTEKLSEGLYKYSFLVPWVRAVDDPVRRATTEALIKSDLLLSRAIKEMSLLNGTEPSVMEYLRKELSVHYSPDGHMFVALVGAKDGEAAVAAYAAPIINEYLAEHLTHLAHNQHDLATKDYRPAGEESVSRDAERSAVELSQASRKRERPEVTTKNTKDTKEDLATEDTEDDELIGVSNERILQLVPVEVEKDAIWKATQEALIKSPVVLSRVLNDAAIYGLPVIQNAKPNAQVWLSGKLSISITPDKKMLLRLSGPTRDKEELKKIAEAVVKSYLHEREIQQKHHNPLFPTLEDQRAADLAYKLLGVELEKLTPEELERVKAKGYQGGLRAIDGGGGGMGGSPLSNGDLLVGLHVWPTESFEQVTEILSRNDLDQLSPMKFYVLRQTQPSDPADTWPDRVVTGRIEVDLDAWHIAARLRSGRKGFISSIKNEIAVLENQRDQLSEMGKHSEGDREQIEASIKSLRINLAQLQETEEAGDSQETMDPGQPALPPELQGQNYPPLTDPGPRGDQTDVPSDALFMPVDPSKSNLPASQKVSYDGKGFDEWRQMWRAELKTEKRTECIKALAAFGRAGMGQKASEAILEVAAEYDFSSNSIGEVLDLKNAIQEVLTSGDGIPAEYWLPVFVERLKQDPDKWGSMASWVLGEVRSKNPEVLKLLISITENQTFKSSIRRGAVESIVHQLDSGNKDAERVVRNALTSDDPLLVSSAILEMGSGRLDQFPEQLDLLFSKDKNIQRHARNRLDWLSHSPQAEMAINMLLAIADDPARGEDRGIALYALATIAKQGNGRQFFRLRDQVWEMITAILQKGDVELIPYALHSGARLKGSNINYVIIQLGKSVNEERVQQIDQAREKAEDLRMYFDGNEGGGPFD
jgi:beta-lactamase regulating signal transducer with metallopeptidase domain